MINASAVEFRFLSQAMAYPDKNFVEALREVRKRNAENASFMDVLIESAKSEEINEFQAEHTRLFISGFPDTPCPPYESFFLEGRLFGRANQTVQSIYSEWAMDVVPAMADHIATEFEFLSLLLALYETSDEFADAENVAQNFLNEHLLKWTPGFAKKLRKNSRIEFYSLYANILLELTGKK